MARVLLISFSDLASDPRVDRQIEVLRTHHSIVAAGTGSPRHPVDEFIDISTPSRSRRGALLGLGRLLLRRYHDVYWTHPTNTAVFERLRHVRPDATLANDLAALPIAIRLGAPVVFDAHEHAPTELEDRFWWRTLIRPYVYWLCRRYIPEAAEMTTVSDGIADAYERETGVRARVVTNAPPRHDLVPAPVEDPVRVLHHGAAREGRGLEQLVSLASLLDERFAIDFVLVEGSPGLRDALVRLARGNPRIRFPEPWAMTEIVEHANHYNIGLYLLQPKGFNATHALPNKFFEFVQARLAIAIGPSPEMARVVTRFNCGIVAEDFRPETLAAKMNALTAEEISEYQHASDRAAETLCAEMNQSVILATIQGALRSRSVGASAYSTEAK